MEMMRRESPGASDDAIVCSLNEWSIHPFYEGQTLMGCAFTLGTEFHCRLLPGFKLNRSMMREFMRPLFDKYGFLTTRVEHGDTANRRFNKVFGFVPTWADETHQYFILTSIPFDRKTPCQQLQ